MALNELTGSNRGETGSSGRSCSSAERCCLSTFGNISHGSHLSFSRHFPHFQCFTCKNVLIGYKNQNSRYFSVLLPYSFALKNMLLLFFNPHFFFLFFQTPDVFFVDPELVSVRSYMCWASIMSKYLASMI